MALYLVQHGQCHAKDSDPSKGLTEEGRAAATRIAGVAKGYGVPVSCILHSGKKRARQTAEIFEAALAPPDGLLAKSGLCLLYTSDAADDWLVVLLWVGGGGR